MLEKTLAILFLVLFLCQPTSLLGFNGAGDEVARSADNIAEDAASQALLGAGGGFACGPDLTCDSTTQYCYVLIGGPKGVPPGYSCVDVSNVAPPLTCETIPDIGVGCECADSDGDITVTCTAP
jgi:hypothetical protein